MKNGLMKKLLSFAAMVFFSVLMALPSHAADFPASQLKKMSTFLSNFTEVGMRDFTAEEVLDPKNPAEMVRFCIWHHWLNTHHRTIKPSNDRQHGDAMIDGVYVKESLKRYFNYDLKEPLPSVVDPDDPQGNSYYSDGDHYYFYNSYGPGGDPAYYAQVTKAVRLPDGNIQMTGYIYNAEEPSDITGSFTALARPHTWKGKATWAIISMKTRYR